MPAKSKQPPSKTSAFSELGLKATVAALHEEIRELYTADDVPWIIGYSGGKDSTATLQLIWAAVAGLPVEKRTKPIHVISTDTLVENPVVAAWVTRSLDSMGRSAREQSLPIQPHRLTPKVEESFWVNLIGKGYPAPRHKFRWCTERLKIKPSNRFILGVVNKSGHAILCLGARKSESQARARVLERASKARVVNRLNTNPTMPGCFVYTPIEDWTNDDVWMFLTRVKNPWGYNNTDLLGMYAGASADGECPLVVDTSRVVARHVGSLEYAIVESFHHLARKPKLLHSVRIDPASFQIALLDATGNDVPFQSFSAGERQLLATAILWALAEVSGRPVPLVIDTPLGRLDSHHRSHIVQRHLPAASHQVILLSTDKEIVGRYRRLSSHKIKPLHPIAA